MLSVTCHLEWLLFVNVNCCQCPKYVKNFFFFFCLLSRKGWDLLSNSVGQILLWLWSYDWTEKITWNLLLHRVWLYIKLLSQNIWECEADWSILLPGKKIYKYEIKFTSIYIRFPRMKPTVLIGRQSDSSHDWVFPCGSNGMESIQRCVCKLKILFFRKLETDENPLKEGSWLPKTLWMFLFCKDEAN